MFYYIVKMNSVIFFKKIADMNFQESTSKERMLVISAERSFCFE